MRIFDGARDFAVLGIQGMGKHRMFQEPMLFHLCNIFYCIVERLFF